MSSDRRSAQLPFTIQRRHFQIRPTRYGYVFILMVLGMFVGSVNYNSNLGFLLAFLLGSMAFVSLVHTCKNIHGVTILSINSRSVFAGQQVKFEFRLKSGGKKHVQIGIGFNKGNAIHCDIVEGHNQRVDVCASATSRGLLKPGRLIVFSDYPLGFFSVCANLNLNLECLVYPKPKFTEFKTNTESVLRGCEGRSRGLGVDDFMGLRFYSPGDPLQRISWRASSRGQGLFVKDFKWKNGSSLYLDWHSFKESGVEHKLSMLCYMILTAHRNDVMYGVRLPGKTIEPDRGDYHRTRCLKALALY
jgi:uncharacterized protein (DUF58 family)